MKVYSRDQEINIALTPAELKLLQRALERASFVDTPAVEQPDIAAFCVQLLDALAAPKTGK